MTVKGKYTLSYHYFGIKHPSNHLDLFLEVPGKEKLFQIKLEPASLSKKNCMGIVGAPHRSVYLHYQGKIDKGRGTIRILRKGRYKTGGWIFSENLPINIKVAKAYTKQ